MMLLRCSAKGKGIDSVVALSGRLPCPALFLSPEAAARMARKEIEASFFLARLSFEGNANISDNIGKEALLFLSRQTNFSSALSRIGARCADDFVLACEKECSIPAVKRALGLGYAGKMRLPEWGAKKGHYYEAERAIEQMALARVKN